GPLKAYATAIPARRTNRRPFRDQTIPGSVLTNLAEAAWAENAMLRIYEDPNEVARIIDLLHEADLVERTDPTLRRERGSWVGRAGGGEGIPEPSLGPRPREPRTAFRELGDTVRGPRDHAEFEKTPTLAILSTTHDERIDWVRAGQALQRLLLTATKAGLSASFMNQPLEQDALRWLVRSPLTGIGHSQMILRIGYGEPVPATPRRPISAVRRELRDAPR
ncbi:MAG: nitroreductase family protein, partial [Actinomycetes bacterium]